ncbi:hypothetical protein SEUCBS140593_001737 [Sporothrix eucalyptigena]|uniref:Uncharacterized protein n=1 Tax=Sporothrix eucalyptigena TaxID=1812306 RepID=A0ABP0B0S4_9PEZI
MAKKHKSQLSTKWWLDYFNEDDIVHWQKLVEVLGFKGHYPSKTQCKKAIKRVYVNIRDFLEAVASNQKVPKHGSKHELLRYTQNTQRYFKRKKIVSGSPLSALLRDIA